MIARNASSSSNKTSKLEALHDKLEGVYGPLDLSAVRDSLDRVLFAHLVEQMPLESAVRAYTSFQTSFVDWNEVRISSAGEVQEVLRGCPEPLELAIAIKDFLQVLFTRHHHVGLEFLREKNISEIRSFFRKHSKLGEAGVSLALEHLKDYPVVPIDSSLHPFLKKAGVIKGDSLGVQELKDLYPQLPREKMLSLYVLLTEHGRQGCPPLTRRSPRRGQSAAKD